MLLSSPPRPKNMAQVATWYNAGKLTVLEAIKWQQYFCRHTNFNTKPGGVLACLDCGLQHKICPLCEDHLIGTNAECGKPLVSK